MDGISKRIIQRSSQRILKEFKDICLSFVEMILVSYCNLKYISIIYLQTSNFMSFFYNRMQRQVAAWLFLPKIRCQGQSVKLIGQGTFGKVYLAINPQNQLEFALKEVVQHPQYRNRELSVLSQLTHPTIVQLKHHFTTTARGQTTLNLLMEKMETGLASVLKEHRKLKTFIPALLPNLIAFQLLKGLAYLQVALFLARVGTKVMQIAENNVSYICSRYYRATELLLNSTSYGGEIDMWSTGCILVELMTFEPIFHWDSSLEQLIEIVKILGTPSTRQVEEWSPINASIQLPVLRGTDWAKILRLYSPSEDEVDLIRKILSYGTKQRIRPLEALRHPYFKDLVYDKKAREMPDQFDFEGLKGKKNKKIASELTRLYQEYLATAQMKKQEEKVSQLSYQFQ